MADEDGEPVEAGYEGERDEAGLRHGTGTATFANGDKYCGGYNAGVREGSGVYEAAGGAKYSGGYVANLREGSGTMAYANGDAYEGAWSKGHRHGQGIYDYANGDYYEGEWVGGVKHGEGIYHFAESCCQFFGYWDRGGFLGGTWTHKDGTVFVGKFETAVDVGSLPAGDGVFRTVGGNAQAVAYGEAGWAKVGDATAAPRSNLTALRDALGIEVPRP